MSFAIPGLRPLLAFLVLVGAAGAGQIARADVTLNPLFSEGAVLQRGMEVPIWGTADEGEKITVGFAGQTVSAVTTGGKWMVRLKALTANAQPDTLTVTGKTTATVKGILVGEVWICSGQSNMGRLLGPQKGMVPIDNADQEIAAADHPNIHYFNVARLASVQPVADLTGKWETCTPATAPTFSAVAYFFARDLQPKIKVPIGLVFSAWGGTSAEAWTSRAALAAKPELQPLLTKFDAAIQSYDAKPPTGKEGDAPTGTAESNPPENKTTSTHKVRTPPNQDPHEPTTLYNGMIAPLQPFAIRGVIWYQGESNGGRGQQYRTLFPTLIADWRQAWSEGDFPFLYVQLPPFQDAKGKPENDPALREAQFMTLKASPHVAMVETMDVGEPNNIHPPHKQAVGGRLALAARALAYGEKLEYSGPLFDSMTVDGAKAVITFTHTGSGLIAKGGDLTGFTISGADNHFVPAQAKIQGQEIVVTSDQVKQPTAVRYGWDLAPVVNLFNREGLPASPFRTDPN